MNVYTWLLLGFFLLIYFNYLFFLFIYLFILFYFAATLYDM